MHNRQNTLASTNDMFIDEEVAVTGGHGGAQHGSNTSASNTNNRSMVTPALGFNAAAMARAEKIIQGSLQAGKSSSPNRIALAMEDMSRASQGQLQLNHAKVEEGTVEDD